MAIADHETVSDHVIRSLDYWSEEFHRLDRLGQRLMVDLWFATGLVSIADLAITYHGLQLGFIEVNPVARTGLVLFGFWSLVILKGVALAIGAINFRILDRRGYLVPATFVLVWGSAVVANLVLILTHTF